MRRFLNEMLLLRVCCAIQTALRRHRRQSCGLCGAAVWSGPSDLTHDCSLYRVSAFSVYLR